MPAPLEVALVAAHAAALLVLPLLVARLVLGRARRALARGAAPAAVYFTSAQWLAHLPAAVMLGLAASIGSPLAQLLMRSLAEVAGKFAPLLLFPFLLLPLACTTFAATLATHFVTRETRGTDLTPGESLRQAAWVLAVLAAPIAGLLGLQTALGFGRPGPGVVVLLASLAAAAFAHAKWSRLAGFEPHAVSHGPLRDRLFALAAKAGASVQQLYILPARRTRMANAFAVQGGVVLLTDWLLAHLESREVDAVLAHELAHVRLGHPRKLALAAAAGAVLGVMSVTVLGFGASVAVGTVLSLAGTRFVSRRFEYQADALAVRLTGDPEALVTGLVRLARLNSLPLDWSRAAEHGLTHPSMLRRVEAIARVAGIPPVRLRELVEGEAPPRDLEAVPDPAGPAGKVFSTRFKQATSGELSWGLLFATVGMAAAGVALVQVLSLPRQLAAPLGALAAFAALVAITDLFAARGIARLRDAVARRLGAAPGSRFVGLAPGAATRVYEGFFDWDLGFIELEDDSLVYRGEETAFRLPRAAILAVRRAGGPPGWIAAPRVAIEWHDPVGGTRGVVQLRPAHSTRLDRLSSDATALLDELHRWRAARPATLACAPVPPPHEAGVTGISLARAAHPSSLLPSAMLLAIGCALVAWSCGLPLWPGSGPGAFDVWSGAMLATVLQRLPWWLAREPRAEPAEQERHAA